jgi:hypothetical protein
MRSGARTGAAAGAAGAAGAGPAKELAPGLLRLEDLQGLELKTWRLYSEGGRPLPIYLRYLGGVWQAYIPAEELRAHGAGLDGALSVQVTAWTAGEAAAALWSLLTRLGLKIERPERAAPA